MTLYNKIKTLFSSSKRNLNGKSVSSIPFEMGAPIGMRYKNHPIQSTHISQVLPAPNSIEEVCSLYNPSNPHKHCRDMNNCDGHKIHFCYVPTTSK